MQLIRTFHQKSSLFFSPNVGDDTRAYIRQILGVTREGEHGNYLGLPSFVGRRKKDILEFIKNRVWNKIQGWKKKNLSKDGKEVLLKSVAQTMPNYAMGVFHLSMDLYTEIERMMNSFW